ncbi:Pentatricopeptide repeat-containing protein At2g31400 [Durusdinium trenchii]|uniref:Chloroplastic n=1 Tax=Durusdinium trenchii TaxID=1381693 RepID=A0ABP0JLG9_9DINO
MRRSAEQAARRLTTAHRWSRRKTSTVENLPLLFKSLSEKKDAKSIFHLLEELRHQAAELDNQKYTIGISTCSRGKLWQHACWLFAVMPKAQVQPNVTTSNTAMISCSKGRQWQLVSHIFQEMPKAQLQPDVFSFNATMSSLQTASHWWEALSLCEAMPRVEVQPDRVSLNTALNALVKLGGQWQKAMSYFAMMPKLELLPDVISYTSVIRTCEEATEWQLALSLFEAMPRSEVQPDLVSYTVAITCCKKGIQWQLAVKFINDMLNSRISPDVVGYSAAITSCEKAGAWQHAFLTLDVMTRALVLPNVISYSAAISSCEKANEWQQALWLFNSMGNGTFAAPVQRNVFSYAAAITACKHGTQWKQALRFLEQMPEEHLEPDRVCYNALLDCAELQENRLGGHLFLQALPLFGSHTSSFRWPEVIDLHGLSEGSAQLLLRWWLSTAVAQRLRSRGGEQVTYVVITGKGRSRQAWDVTDVKAAALRLLHALKLLRREVSHAETGGRFRLKLKKEDLVKVQSAGSIFPTNLSARSARPAPLVRELERETAGGKKQYEMIGNSPANIRANDIWKQKEDWGHLYCRFRVLGGELHTCNPWQMEVLKHDLSTSGEPWGQYKATAFHQSCHYAFLFRILRAMSRALRLLLALDLLPEDLDLFVSMNIYAARMVLRKG